MKYVQTTANEVMLWAVVAVMSNVITAFAIANITAMVVSTPVAKTVVVERMPWLDHADYEALMQCVSELSPLNPSPERCFGVIRNAHPEVQVGK